MTHLGQPDHLPKAVHGSKGGNSESGREPRPAQLRMGNLSEGTVESPSEATSQTRLGWVQKDTEQGRRR